MGKRGGAMNDELEAKTTNNFRKKENNLRRKNDENDNKSPCPFPK
jgi:hypothetical protein